MCSFELLLIEMNKRWKNTPRLAAGAVLCGVVLWVMLSECPDARDESQLSAQTIEARQRPTSGSTTSAERKGPRRGPETPTPPESRPSTARRAEQPTVTHTSAPRRDQQSAFADIANGSGGAQPWQDQEHSFMAASEAFKALLGTGDADIFDSAPTSHQAEVLIAESGEATVTVQDVASVTAIRWVGRGHGMIAKGPTLDLTQISESTRIRPVLIQRAGSDPRVLFGEVVMVGH